MSSLNLGIPFPNRINPTDDNVVNPFNPTTQIAYSLKSDGMTTLDVYNVLGQKVLTAVSEFQAAGSYRVTVDCSRLSSGTFIYRLVSGVLFVGEAVSGIVVHSWSIGLILPESPCARISRCWDPGRPPSRTLEMAEKKHRRVSSFFIPSAHLIDRIYAVLYSG